jgi:peptidoglycan hydrolase-like protein with peptidoglycan-binding domain
MAVLAVLGAGGIGLGCGGDDVGDPAVVADKAAPLQLGARGERVRALHEYLTRYGYFPNDQLQKKYPAWRPLTRQAPKDLSVYDEKTVEAVRHLQEQMGLSTTGVVDAETSAAITRPRCSVPDGMPKFDPSNKFYIGGKGGANLSWFLANTDDLPIATARAEIAAAFATWTAQTGLTITQRTASYPASDITITFAQTSNPNYLAETYYPQDGQDMKIDPDFLWSNVYPPPPGTHDLQTVVLHELGHALGLGHSPLNDSAMFPSYQGFRRWLNIDDSVGVSVNYDTTFAYTGQVKDVAGGADGSVWAIAAGSGDRQVVKWNGSSWVGGNGYASRIAVDTQGKPWVVTQNGSIFHHTTDNPATGQWDLDPSGLAEDIGAGIDGSVWIVGYDSLPDTLIFKYGGVPGVWNPSNKSGMRITVDQDGKPWIVTSNGSIFRHSTNAPLTGTWDQLPGSFAVDIGIMDGNYAWMETKVQFGVKMTLGYSVWNEQAAVGTQPAVAQWKLGFERVNVGASLITGIGVASGGRPLMINESSVLLSSTK